MKYSSYMERAGGIYQSYIIPLNVLSFYRCFHLYIAIIEMLPSLHEMESSSSLRRSEN